MKKLLLATAAGALIAGAAGAEEIKIGISLGLTGPLESIAPPIQKALLGYLTQSPVHRGARDAVRGIRAVTGRGNTRPRRGGAETEACKS